jgi:hypothetical protein
MWRLMHFIVIAATLVGAGYAYSIKYETMWYAEQVVITRNAIAKERDAISQLRTEWAKLSQPERIQDLANRYLDLQQLNLNQIVRPRDLPDITPKIDVIGSTIDAIMAAPASATPATPGSIRAPMAAAAKTTPNP